MGRVRRPGAAEEDRSPRALPSLLEERAYERIALVHEGEVRTGIAVDFQVIYPEGSQGVDVGLGLRTAILCEGYVAAVETGTVVIAHDRSHIRVHPQRQVLFPHDAEFQ